VNSELAATAVASRWQSAEEQRSSSAEAKRTTARRIAAIVLIVAGVSFVATLIATTRYGIGLTPDSFMYLNGARSLASGHGYLSDGGPITEFPPGYSFVLSLGEHTGIAVETGARLLAALCSAATVVLGYVLLRRHIRSSRIIVGATIIIGCSAVLLQAFKEALSEHLFIIVVLLFILVAETLMRRPRALLPLATLLVLTWAAFYVRYAGIVLVPIAIAILLIALWPSDWRGALVRSAGFIVAGVAVPALWMKRNVDAGSGLLGNRQDAAASPLTNVARTSRELSSWVATNWGPGAVRLLVFLALFAVVALAIGLLVRGDLAVPTDWREMLPAVLVTSFYLIYLTVTASLVAFAAINTRFMSPVYVPAVVIGAWVFERVRRQVGALARKVITVVAAAWLVINLVWFGGVFVSAVRSGAGGYATRRWHDSKLMDEVRKLDGSVPVYTNDSAAIELFTGRVVPLSVARTFFASNQKTGSLPKFMHEVSCAGHVELVWFLPNGRPRLYSPDQLGQFLHVAPKIKRGDGVIYELRPRPGAGPRASCK
jgi:hypothetical protein